MQYGAQLTGVRELDRILDKMPVRMQTQLVKVGMRAAAKRPIKYARQEAGKHRGSSGQLRRSIGGVLRTYRNTGISVLVIGPRKGFVSEASDMPAHRYAPAIEYGWQGRDPDPFIHRTLNVLRASGLADFQAGCSKRLDLLIKEGKVPDTIDG